MKYFYELIEIDKGWKWKIFDESGKVLKTSSNRYHVKDEANFIVKMWAKQMFGIEVELKTNAII